MKGCNPDMNGFAAMKSSDSNCSAEMSMERSCK